MPVPPPLPAPAQLPLLVDQVDHRDCEDYGIDPDRPDSPLSGDGIDLAEACSSRAHEGSVGDRQC